MDYLKRLGLAALAALALTGFLAGHAWATVMEVGGESKNESIAFTMSLEAGSSLAMRDTSGFSFSTCNKSHLKGKTASPFTGTTVTGPVEELTYTGCEHNVTVHKPGQLYIEWTSSTNGRVYSELAEWTVFSSVQQTYINCKTGTGVLIGNLTGVKEGHARLDINATLDCSPHISSVRLTGTYTVTSPTGLGVLDAAPPATTLEVSGTKKNESVSITTTLKSGTSTTLRDTFGFSANTCTGSHVKGKTTSPFTGTTVTGPVEEMTYTGCEHSVTVHKPGQLYVEWTSGTNGRVYSENAEVTVYSTIHGTYINCKTGSGTPIGTLTGVKEGNATLDISATLNCEPHLSSAKWTGTYTVTSPEGLGVSS